MPDPLIPQVTFRRLLLRSIGLPFVIMLFLVLVLIWQITALLNAVQWVDHTNQVIAQTRLTQKQIVDIQSGLRGYYLIGDPQFLQRYARAQAAFETDASDLKRLTSDNPGQQQRLAEIRAAYDRWFSVLQQAKAISSRDYIARNRPSMDALNKHFEDFIAIEENQRTVRSQIAQQTTQRALTIIIGLALLLGLLLAILNRRQLLSLSASYDHSLNLIQNQTAALRASEIHLATTLQSIGDAVIATDAQGKITLINRNAESLTGWPQAEAQGKDLAEVFVIVNEETRQPVESPVEKVLREGVVVGLANHTIVIARDGTETPIDDTGAPIRDDEGNLSGVVLVFHDITTRNQAEKELRRANAFREQVMDSTVFGVGALDLEKNFVLVNPRMAEIFGYPAEELLGKSFSKILQTEDLPRVNEQFHQTIEQGIPASVAESHILRKSGEEASVTLGWSPVRDEDKTVGLVVTVEDTTEKKRMENQLLQAQKLESIGRLAGGVSHDFNNLLTAILGNIEMFEEDCALDATGQEYLLNVKEAAEKAANLTRQLLTFARRQVIEPKTVNLNDLIFGLDKMLRRLIGEHIELVMLPDEDLRSVKVDSGQFEQILVNLVVNARDAMLESGKITIETHNVTLDEEYTHQHEGVLPGEYVILAVSDTGMGMDEATQLHIFEPFFTTKEKGRGTGLGLATVYGIVKQAGGHIWLYSEVGKGATFKIYLPSTTAEAEAVSAPQTQPHPDGGSETILLVEDEPSVRAMGVKTLRRRGYTVLEATNGEEALRVVQGREQKITLLLTDVIMPQMNGKELADRLQQLHPDLKVLFASGYTENTIVHHGVLEPGIAFLSKPFTPTLLARRVRDVLDNDDKAS